MEYRFLQRKWETLDQRRLRANRGAFQKVERIVAAAKELDAVAEIFARGDVFDLFPARFLGAVADEKKFPPGKFARDFCERLGEHVLALAKSHMANTDDNRLSLGGGRRRR